MSKMVVVSAVKEVKVDGISIYVPYVSVFSGAQKPVSTVLRSSQSKEMADLTREHGHTVMTGLCLEYNRITGKKG